MGAATDYRPPEKKIYSDAPVKLRTGDVYWTGKFYNVKFMSIGGTKGTSKWFFLQMNMELKTEHAGSFYSYFKSPFFQTQDALEKWAVKAGFEKEVRQYNSKNH